MFESSVAPACLRLESHTRRNKQSTGFLFLQSPSANCFHRAYKLIRKSLPANLPILFLLRVLLPCFVLTCFGRIHPAGRESGNARLFPSPARGSKSGLARLRHRVSQVPTGGRRLRLKTPSAQKPPTRENIAGRFRSGRYNSRRRRR